MNSPPSSIRQPTLLHAWIAFLVCFLGLVIFAHASFGIKPASDDFTLLPEIHRGTEQGISVFFTNSVTGGSYRPLKSLTLWAFGNLFHDHPLAGIRTAHLLGLGWFAIVVMIWTRAMRLGIAGTWAAVAVAVLHPVLPQAWGSIDGVDSLASSAFVWLGAWFIWRWREKTVIASTIAALVCFIVASGFKEYAFGLVPLAALTIACFWNKRRWKVGLIVIAALLAAVVAILLLRQVVIPPGYERGYNYIHLTPVQIIENIAILATGLLFFGNSIWVFVNWSLPVAAIVGVSCLTALIVITAGIALRLRSERTEHDPQPMGRWVIFMLLSFFAASFPITIMFHVSEMYVPPIVPPLALLIGLAADGLAAARSNTIRFTVAALAALALATSLVAIHRKVEGLLDVGDRAQKQLDQIIAMLGPNPHDKKVAVLFDSRDLPPRRTYAVFRMGDEILLVHPMVFEWPLPGRHIVLGASLVDDPLEHPEQYDLILHWDVANQRFVKNAP